MVFFNMGEIKIGLMGGGVGRSSFVAA